MGQIGLSLLKGESILNHCFHIRMLSAHNAASSHDIKQDQTFHSIKPVKLQPNSIWIPNGASVSENDELKLKVKTPKNMSKDHKWEAGRRYSLFGL